jgi:hypothetical protein
MHRVSFLAADDTTEIDFVERYLVLAGLATVVDGVEERRHLLERIGLVRRLPGVVFVEQRVALAGRLSREMLADQRVAISRFSAILRFRKGMTFSCCMVLSLAAWGGAVSGCGFGMRAPRVSVVSD